MPASTLAATACAVALALAYGIHVTILHRVLGTWKIDPTTRLPVKRAFYRLARRPLRHSDSLVLFVDLDRFKQVNDAHGHEAGNRVLRMVAIRLREHFGNQAVVGRLSGDEFAVVAALTDDWKSVVHQLAALIQTPIDITPTGRHSLRSITIGVSIGAVPLSGVRRPVLSGVLNLAEEHCYAAKYGQGDVSSIDRPDHERVTQPADRHPLLRLRDTRPLAEDRR